MRAIACLILLIAAAAALPDAGLAAAEGGKGAANAAANLYEGIIAKLNTATNTVLVEGTGKGEKKGNSRLFSVDAKTVVTVKGAAATVNDLKVGQQVQVTHSPVDLAERIEVVAAGNGTGKRRG